MGKITKIVVIFLMVSIFAIIASAPVLLLNNSSITVLSDAEKINNSELQQQVVTKLNNERVKDGDNRLVLRDEITEVARYKSERMKNEEYISHTAPDGETVRDRFVKFDVRCQNVGENLAKTYYDRKVNTEYGGQKRYTSMDELSNGIVKQFMNSQSHKENLLRDDWESHGLSISITEDNAVYVAHKFCQK